MVIASISSLCCYFNHLFCQFYYYNYCLYFRICQESEQKHVESFQFMQFDVNGNLFVYEPGAGCSSTPHKIEQGFSQEDLEISFSGKEENCSGLKLDKFPTLAVNDFHKIVPKNGMASFQIGVKTCRCVESL